MQVFGKKGCGIVTAYGPNVVVYEYEYQKEKRRVAEPLSDVWFHNTEQITPPGWSGENLKSKEEDG